MKSSELVVLDGAEKEMSSIVSMVRELTEKKHRIRLLIESKEVAMVNGVLKKVDKMKSYKVKISIEFRDVLTEKLKLICSKKYVIQFVGENKKEKQFSKSKHKTTEKLSPSKANNSLKSAKAFTVSIKKSINSIVNNLTSQIVKISGKIKSVFGNICKSIGNKFKTIKQDKTGQALPGENTSPIKGGGKISSAFSSIKGSIISIFFSVASKIKDVLVETFKQGFKNAKENQVKSMEMQNIIEKNGHDPQSAKSKTKDYTRSMIQIADSTTFDNSEVMTAGTKALQMSKGDTSKAQSMVKLATNMAAMSPGKSLEDAMEALSSAQQGDGSQLKDYGFNVSEQSIGAAGSDIMSLQAGGVGLEKYFEGGNDKLAQTFQGKLDIIKEFGSSVFTAVSSSMLSNIDFGFLDKFIQFFLGNKDAVVNGAEKIGKVVGRVFKGIENVFGSLMPTFSDFMSFLGTQKDFFVSIFDTIMQWIDVFKNIWIEVWPLLSTILCDVWTFIQPIFDAIISVISELAPIFEWCFIEVICPAVQAVWEFCKPVFELISDFITTIINGVKKVISFFGNIFVPHDEPVSTSNGSSNASATGETMTKLAVGIGYVPRDNYPALLHQGERVLTASESRQLNSRNGGVNITIPKLADTINASNVNDIDTFIKRLEEKLIQVAQNMSYA